MGITMNEVILLKAKMNPKVPKGIFIFECVLCAPFVLIALFLGIWIGLIFLLGPIIAYYGYKNSKDVRLIITNKRVSVSGGKFGVETNIPIDSITAVSKGFLKTVRVTSSSGVIGFPYLENPTEVYNTINNLINKRTNMPNEVYPTQQILEVDDTKQIVPTVDNMEMLRNYKKLLDDGIITQEEFDQKKKQLLGL